MNTLTHTTLTGERLSEIQTRAASATPGPWGTYMDGSRTVIDIAADLEETGHGYRARRGIARCDEEPLDNDPTHKDWTDEDDWDQVLADADFIAHARNDVAVLLDEVQRLRIRVGRAEQLVAHTDMPPWDKNAILDVLNLK